MDGIELPLDDAGTGALEAYLDSDRAPPACMLISELDGFLTAGILHESRERAPRPLRARLRLRSFLFCTRLAPSFRSALWHR
jgi:hypothetical protein